MTHTEQPTTQAVPLQLPAGLLGFERHRTWMLVSHPAEAPFQWLQAAEEGGPAFVVVPPATVEAAYRPDVAPADATWLQINDPADALVMNIVTLHPDGHATVNLKGPLVINRHTFVGKQVVPLNAAEYSTQHPLPVAC